MKSLITLFEPAPIPAIFPGAPASSSASPNVLVRQALDALEAKSHLIRQGIAAEEQSDKETGNTYARQVKNYQFWWDKNQAALLTNDPSHLVIPAFPIIPTKVTLFLEYETTRQQVRENKHSSSLRALPQFPIRNGSAAMDRIPPGHLVSPV
jgi:hypothetical protein